MALAMDRFRNRGRVSEDLEDSQRAKGLRAPRTPTEALGRAMQAVNRKRLAAFTAPAAPQRLSLAQALSPRAAEVVGRMGLDIAQLEEDIAVNMHAHRDPRPLPSAAEVEGEIARMTEAWGLTPQKGGK